MSAEEYWHGPTRLCESYRKAWEIRRDNQFAREWRAGIYTMHAVGVALDRAFNGEKAKAEYPDAPLYSSEEIRREIEEKRERAAAEAEMKRLDLWAAKVNRMLSGNDGRGEGDRN